MSISIYLLRDPRNREVRYIGQSYDPDERYAQHCALQRWEATLKSCWVRRLAHLGLRPLLEVVEEDIEDELDAYQQEKYWMRRYTQQGHDVLNQKGLHDAMTTKNLCIRKHFLRSEHVAPGELVGQRLAVQTLYLPYVPPAPPNPTEYLPRFLAECAVYTADTCTPRYRLYEAYTWWWWDVLSIGKRLPRAPFEAALLPLAALSGVTRERLYWRGVSVMAYVNRKDAELWDRRHSPRGA